MTLTARDRKIAMVLAPLLVIAAYWFLLLSPKRDEAAKAGEELAKQEQRRDQAKAAAETAEQTKKTFAVDYSQLVKLGKAIPAELDMPTVIVQLESAAQGTDIEFTRIAAGERSAAPSTPQPPANPGTSSGSQPAPAAAGGPQAQSAPGGAVESAGNAVNSANANTTAGAQAANGAPAPTAGGAAGAATATGLESVPIELEFEGGFFRLADFFHRVKRFVHVAEKNVAVSGRLLTIESLTFSSDPEIFPRLSAELKATVYLSPAAEGATAGATPAGPAQPVPASGAAPAPAPAPAPAATATP